MSNKSLIIAVAVILLVFLGSVYGYNKYKQGQNSDSNVDSYAQNNTDEKQNQQSNTPLVTPTALTTPVPSATSVAAAVGQCTRNYNSNKLKTDKVNITNRQAEIKVKDFGTITLSFFDKDAPKTVENFLRLADAGYYNCLTFHRVAKGFVIQGGDPTGTGSGGDSAFGGEFADEIKADSSLYKGGYKHGYLAMANRGPNTNTSQFFIMLGDVPLPPSYTIFGKVTTGLDVVDKIGQVAINPQMGPEDGAPKTPVVMESVKIK